MPDQHRDIFATLAKWRNMEREHTNPIEEVFAELPVLDHGPEIASGGDNHAHVDLNGFGASQPLKFAFLKNAKEFCLKLEGQFADFVEEESRTIGNLETAHFPS